MNWRAIKQKVQLFDQTGLDQNTIKTLRLLIVAVMGGVVWGNITGGIAITGYLKELGASDFLYGVILSLSPIANAFQFLASYLMEKTRKRKTMFLISGLIQRTIWLPFALIPFFIPLSMAQLRLSMAVVCVLISASVAPFMNVTFFSICADVVPMRIRGRYFATRSRIATFFGFIVGILVGLLLDQMQGFKGYAIVFTIAAVVGTLDVICFFFMDLPQLKPASTKTSLFKIIHGILRDKRYMKTVLCLTAWLFSVQLCAPYFNVYMRNNMAMTNLDITIYGQVVSSVFLIFFITRWGRAIDHYGNKPILRISTLLTSFMPLLFFPTGKGMLAMVFIANALSGATYCAVDLSAQNLFMGQAREDNKSMYFAVYFIFTQLLGLAVGSAMGGWLLDNVLVHAESWNAHILNVPLSRYNWLFLLSWVLRIFTSLALMPSIDEAESYSVRGLLTEAGANTRLSVERTRGEIKRIMARRKYDKLKKQED